MELKMENCQTLDEANDRITLLTFELEALSAKMEIKEKLLLAANEERNDLNEQLVGFLRQLDDANKKLKELDKRKSAFVSLVSHEFKNPLLVIQENLSIILEKQAGELNEQQEKIVGRALKNVNRMQRLVTDLLDVGKIESGKVELKKEAVGIAQLTSEIVNDRSVDLSKKALKLETEGFDETGTVWADKDKLTQVIVNLLSNAIKYAPDGGRIHIKLREIDDEVRFEISNTGAGIPEEYIVKIFDKFERVNAEKEEGTGLGLPIARDMIELHNGKLWVENIAGGCRFVFTLPRNLTV